MRRRAGPMRSSAMVCLILGLGLANASCDPATAVAVPVLVISATWDVQGQEGRRFSFSSEQDGQDHGSFTGTEFVDDPFGEYEFTGSWSNGQIQMVVQRPGGNVAYTANFQHDLPTSLTFHSTQETFVVLQP